MASERDLELLDDYISNRLNAQDKSVFEQRLEADPELQGEYQLQNKIAEGIRQARSVQLKAMLGAIPTTAIPDGGETSVGAKVGMWVAGAAVIGAGIYFYLTTTETTEPTGPETSQIREIKPEEKPAEPQQDTPETVVVPEAKAKPEASKPSDEKIVAPKVKKDDSSKTKSSKPAINAFDPSDEESEEATVNQADLESVGKAGAADMPVVNDNTNKKFKFHYQIKDGKLFLYGPFEKNLYELMAFYSGTKVTRFLYHQSKYYLLSDDTEKVKLLSPINDPKLIDKLNKSRQKGN